MKKVTEFQVLYRFDEYIKLLSQKCIYHESLVYMIDNYTDVGNLQAFGVVVNLGFFYIFFEIKRIIGMHKKRKTQKGFLIA